MPRIAIFITLLFCVATTPLFIASETMILGFPGWAFYSLIMIVIYSLIICFVIERFWISKSQDK